MSAISGDLSTKMLRTVRPWSSFTWAMQTSRRKLGTIALQRGDFHLATEHMHQSFNLKIVFKNVKLSHPHCMVDLIVSMCWGSGCKSAHVILIPGRATAHNFHSTTRKLGRPRAHRKINPANSTFITCIQWALSENGNQKRVQKY